ncbi:hypothetical protein CRENBAI_022074 [Crenichthys baileyi]|uniref:Ig-like domain-containing protein n=1 Tax=Crenichthys baileyi TaxID=28760 RepID=A0AAV9QZ81_9TELE
MSIHQPALKVLRLGDSVNLSCSVSAEDSEGEQSIYWFRRTAAQPELMYTSERRCTGLSDGTLYSINCTFNLELNPVRSSDAGTYHCALASGRAVVFGEGTKVEILVPPPLLVYCLSVALILSILGLLVLSFLRYKLKFKLCSSCKGSESSVQNTDVSSSTFIHQEGVFYSANVGSSITLPCFYGGGAVMIYWFKQTLGQKPNAIASFYKHDGHGNFYNEHKNKSRFALEVGNGKSHLRIFDLLTSDSATYYCVAIDATKFEFGDGATVSVEDPDFNIHTLIHQPVSDTSQPGGSGTLNCTVDTGGCNGEHSFYWFKEAKGSHPGLIYTHGGRNDQCNKTTMTQTHTCDYSLPLRSQNVYDEGTDHCAVASCGHMLFGDWKHKESADGDGPRREPQR